MIKLIDFTGKTIVLGDIVITIVPYGRYLCNATVFKICEEKLGLKQENYKGKCLFYRRPKEVVVRTHELNSL